ncbi:interleukin-17 receptor C-like protein [Labeo rohita]|uniref:Interleukin-17 receptor C-like protein n=1 Tax=Labeo rohita TaxID=84645 RepID=A0A498MRC3_LABRO|nr:interleukin-17 receptor C-like protein [Labeo rohita]
MLLLVSVPLCIFTRAHERIELSADHALTFGQGIVHCEVKSGGPTCIQNDKHVYVSGLDAHIVQCQKQQTWRLCLKVLVNVTVTDADQPVTGDGSGDEEAEEPHEEMREGAHQEDLDNMTTGATVRVCFAYSSQHHSSTLRFTVLSSAFDDSATLQVWMSLVVEIPKAELGGSVLVHFSQQHPTKHLNIPKKEEVCSKGFDAVFCKGSSVSVSLSEAETHHKQAALVWNISAPCRLEAQLWLCRKSSGLDSSCHALNGRSRVHTRLNDSWMEADHRHWVRKCWVSRWLKVDDVNSASGGVEVLLVCPPDADHTVTEPVCRLCSSLSSVGFSVSLDLWKHSEISALGPVPWLHSCLDRVQRCRGKAVLVLTQAACERAEEWSCRVAEQKPEKGRKTWVKGDVQSSTCSEVFDASLSCILADYLLGRAGERFMLARFDGQSPVTVLPEFFRELPLFSLPSQSLDFITELTQGTRKGQKVSERWVRAGALRAASQAVSRALRGPAGPTGHTCARLPQDSVEPRTEKAWETVLLQAD